MKNIDVFACAGDGFLDCYADIPTAASNYCTIVINNLQYDAMKSAFLSQNKDICKRPSPGHVTGIFFCICSVCCILHILYKTIQFDGKNTTRNILQSLTF